MRAFIRIFQRLEHNLFESYNRISNHCSTNNARAAANLLTPKQFGAQYSQQFIRSYIVKEQELQYQQQFAYIQGQDSIFPSSFSYNLQQRIGGYDREQYKVIDSTI